MDQHIKLLFENLQINIKKNIPLTLVHFQSLYTQNKR
jgi:hypothetical protein